MNCKRLLTIFLSCCLLVMSVMPVVSFAADVTGEVVNLEINSTGFPRNYNADWYQTTAKRDMHYINGYGRQQEADAFFGVNHTIVDYWTLYCIEIGGNLKTGTSNRNPLKYKYTESTSAFWDRYIALMDPAPVSRAELIRLLGLILNFGYTGKIYEGKTTWNRVSINDNIDGHGDIFSKWLATQLLVWEVIVGERDASFNHISVPSGTDSILDTLPATYGTGYGNTAHIMVQYRDIESKVQNVLSFPSSMSLSRTEKRYLLPWNADENAYILELSDADGRFSGFSFSCSQSGVTAVPSEDGKKLTIRSEGPLSGDALVFAEKKFSRSSVIAYGDGKEIKQWHEPITNISNYQDIIDDGSKIEDSFRVYLTAFTAAGSLKIIKTSGDGNISNIAFTVSGNGIEPQTVKTGTDGTVTVPDLPEGTYTVTETNPDAARYTIESAKNVTLEAGKQTEVSFTNTLKPGSLVIKKTSDDGKIADITFTVSGNGIEPQTVKTGTDGTVTVTDLPEGTYTVTETNPDATRYTIESAKNVTVEAGKQTEVSFTNTLKPGSLVIKKTSDDGKIADITFTVSGNGVEPRTVKTGTDGTVTVTDLPEGTYTVTETNPDTTRYTIESAKNVTVEAGKQAEVSFTNTVNPGSLVIKKTSDDGKIADITFTVSGSGIEPRTVKTGTDGTVTVSDLPEGTYTVTETNPDAARYTIESAKNVTLEAGKQTEVSFTNTLKPGSLVIKKTSDDGKIADITFTVSGNGIEPRTVKTGTDGTVTVTDLPEGTYTVTETNPDTTRYTIENAKNVAVEAGKQAEVSFTNTVKPGSLVIKKTSDDGKVADITFTVSGSGIEPRTVKTGTDGTVTVPDLPEGTYTVTETNPDVTRYTIESAKNVTLEAGKGSQVSFHNTVNPGSLKVTKTSEDGKVNGIDFTVSDGAGTLITITTGPDGTAVADDLKEDEYVVEEVNPDMRTYKTENAKTVSVIAGDETEVSFNNTLIRGSLKIIKTAEDDQLEGFLFTVTGTDLADGSTYYGQYETDETGIILIEDLVPGTYTVHEESTDGSKRYVIPKDQTVTVVSGETEEVPVYNALFRTPETGDRSSRGAWLFALLLSAAGLILLNRKRYTRC